MLEGVRATRRKDPRVPSTRITLGGKLPSYQESLFGALHKPDINVYCVKSLGLGESQSFSCFLNSEFL